MNFCRRISKYLILHQKSKYFSSKSDEAALGAAMKTIKNDIKLIYKNMDTLQTQYTNQPELLKIATYINQYQGKDAGIAKLAMMVGRALNIKDNDESILEKQQKLAMSFELLLTLNYYHDDLMDNTPERFEHPTVHTLWNYQKVHAAGNFVFAATMDLLKEFDPQIIMKICDGFVTYYEGDAMQFYVTPIETDRMDFYKIKTFKKSVISARTIEAVAMVSDCNYELKRLAFELGKKLGMLILTYNDYSNLTGNISGYGSLNEVASDLREGHATAAVLFAAEEHPELHEIIRRRFSVDGDVEKTYDIVVNKSQGMQKTQKLVESLANEAKSIVLQFNGSPYKQLLVHTCDEFVKNVHANKVTG